MSMKNSDDIIGNRTRDFPACSTVSQPTVPPHAPLLWHGSSNSFILIYLFFACFLNLWIFWFLYSLLDLSVQSRVLHYVGDSSVHITISLLCSAHFLLYLCFRLVQQFSTLTEYFAIFKCQILYSLPLVLQVVLHSQSNLCWTLWCFEAHCRYVCLSAVQMMTQHLFSLLFVIDMWLYHHCPIFKID
jgi:hypothetical protein